MIERVADLYRPLELPVLSNESAREIHADAVVAQQALGQAGLPVAMSISQDMDLLVVAGPEGLLGRLLSTPAG